MAEPGKPPTPTPGKRSHPARINSALGAVAKGLTTAANAAINAEAGLISGPNESYCNDGTGSCSTQKKDKKGVFKAIRNNPNKENAIRQSHQVQIGGHSFDDDEKTPTKCTGYSSLYVDLRSDDAEDAVLSNVEKRGSKTVAAEDGFRPAVEGESPPFNVPSLGQAFYVPNKFPSSGDSGRASSPSFRSIALKVLAAQRLGRAAPKNAAGERKGRHRRAQSLLSEMDEENINQGGPSSDFGINKGRNFSDFEKVFGDDASSRLDDSDDDKIGEVSFEVEGEADLTADGEIPHEGLPLLGGSQDDADMSSKFDSYQHKQWRARQVLVNSQWKRLRGCFNPVRLYHGFTNWFVHSMLMIAIPLFTAALVLFYVFGDPEPPAFLAGSATLSWWFNFIGEHASLRMSLSTHDSCNSNHSHNLYTFSAGRQLLLFELARFCQFILIDCLVLSSRLVSQSLGPWVTMFCIQSKGWPFIVGSWGFWSLILLHGDHEFQVHWLYFTKIAIYSIADSGAHMLNTEPYLRILLCMVLAGVLGTLKRTTITLIFGRRMFGE